jgi:hypothetical protein
MSAHPKTTLKSVATKLLIIGAMGLVAGIAVSLVAVLGIYDVAGECLDASKCDTQELDSADFAATFGGWMARLSGVVLLLGIALLLVNHFRKK